MPPSRARAMASSLSVTVSMAEDRMGIFRARRGLRCVLRFTSPGSTPLLPGSRSTSSNDKDSVISPIGHLTEREGFVRWKNDETQGRFFGCPRTHPQSLGALYSFFESTRELRPLLS